VITVCFNSAAHIADALRSVDQQTWTEREHIVVDGASRDDTLAIVEQFRQPWRRVVSEPDDGIYDAMNKGIRLASGDVVGFINSDDFYASRDVLARVAAAFSDDRVDACYGDLCYVEQDNVDKVVRYWRSSAFKTGLFATGWVPPHPTLFLRRSVLEQYGGFDLRYRIAADFELMARLIEVKRVSTVYLPEVLVNMRLGGTTNRSWSNILKQNQEIWQALGAHRLRPSLASFVLGKVVSRGKQYFARPA
jgi:glycosyltransferase involved in cell wall biosynthesis